AALGGRALALQDAEVVAVERGRPLAVPPVALLRGLRHQDPERAARLAAARRPVEPVLSALVAAEMPSVPPGRLAVVASGGVGALRGDVVLQDTDDGQLVAPDAAVQHFLAAGLCVERPTGGRLDQRHRERPGLVAEDQLLA